MSDFDGARERVDRVGFSIGQTDARTMLDAIVEAEAAGVRQIWVTQGPGTTDAVTLYAAAFARTETIRLGTSIVPTYPRHPLALAQQAATAAAVGPGRLRLGVGTSHRPTIEPTYGFKMEQPLEHLAEYVAVLRAALWDGKVEHEGRFFTAKSTMNNAAQVPLLISALGENAYRRAGEISDGALAWNCPASYLSAVAMPALKAGAEQAGRERPPLIAHAWIALSTDAEAVRDAAKKQLSGYARLPFYVNMWEAAGFPPQAPGVPSDGLIDNLVIFGDEGYVAERIDGLLAEFDEVLLTGIYTGDVAERRSELIRFVGSL